MTNLRIITMMGVLLLCFLASSYGLHECHVKAPFSQNHLVDFLGSCNRIEKASLYWPVGPPRVKTVHITIGWLSIKLCGHVLTIENEHIFKMHFIFPLQETKADKEIRWRGKEVENQYIKRCNLWRPEKNMYNSK